MADPALHAGVERLLAQSALLVVPRQFAHLVGWYEQMAEARKRLLELLHYRIHQLQYRKRTEIAVEIVRQLEAEGQFPQAHYAFDNGVFRLP